VLGLFLSFDQPASADTLDVAQYRARLVQIRALVSGSRTASTPDRDRMLAQATALLRQTTALNVRGTVVSVDDGPVAAVLAGPDGANRALAVLDLEIASADRTLARPIDPSVADARLREAVGASETTRGSGAWADALFRYIASQLAAFFSGIRGNVPDLRFVPYVLALFGLGLIALILAILGRGTRERIRREVFLPSAGDRRVDDPLVHLRNAEAALARGSARDAIRELYLYVIRSLATRELVRYDAALTDRELLVRAAAIPNAEALGDLVALYERAWFGLREPDAAEAERARTLARRVAP
jgi:Domain of unknown function (DUF4129)